MSISKDYVALVQVKVSDVALKSQLNNIKIKPLTLKVRVDSKDTGAQLNNIISSTKNLESQTTNSLKTTSHYTKSLGKDFTETFGKIVKFKAITEIIGAFTSAVGMAYKSIKDFDDSLIDFRKVSDLSGESLDNYTKKLGVLGDTVYRNRTEMVQSATVFKQANYSDEDTAVLAQVAELYRNVADSEISSGDAGSYVISQMKAFNITAEDSISIIDKTNKLGNEFAVSTSDISTALTKTASTFSTYGNSIEETMGMVVAATELLPKQAGKVSKGLSSIGAEIVKLANTNGKLSYSVGETTKEINLFSASGEMLSTFEVLKTIKTDWDNMSKAQQSSLALSLGMKTQIPVFSAEMNNFGVAIEAVSSALNSQGSAMEENKKRADAIDTKIKMLKKSFDDLVLGEGGINSLIKGFLTASTVILKFADSDVGEVIIKTTLLSGAFLSVTKGITLSTNMFKALGISAIANVTKTVASIAVANGATLGFTGTIHALTVAMASNPLFAPMVAVTLATTAIVIGIKAVTSASKKYEEQQKQEREEHQKLIKTSKDKIAQYNSEKEKLLELKKTYEENTSRIKELNDLKSNGKINTLQLEELENYNKKNLLLEKQIEYEQTLLDIQNEKVEKSSVQTLGDKTQEGFTNSGEIGKITDSEKLKQNTESIEQYKKAIENYADVISGIKLPKSEIDTYQKSLENLNKQIENGTVVETDNISEKKKFWESMISGSMSMSQYEKNTKDATDKIKKLIKENSLLIDIIEPLNSAITSTTGENYNLKKSNEEIIDSAKESAIEYNNTKSNLEEYTKEQIKSVEETQSVASTIGGLRDGITNLQSAYTTMTNAVLEYNETGKMSLATLENLLSLDSDYLMALQNESGQLVVNNKTLSDLIEQKKIDAIVTLQESASSDMLAYSNGEVDKMSSLAKKAVADLGSDIKSTGDKAETSASKVLGFTESVTALYSASGGDISKLTKQQEAISNAYKKIASGISDITIDFKEPKRGDGGYDSKTYIPKIDREHKTEEKKKQRTEKVAKDTTDIWKKSYDNKFKNLEHLHNMELISDKEYFGNLQKLNEKYFGKSSGKHKKYLSEYRKNEESIYEGLNRVKESHYNASFDKLEHQHEMEILSDKEYYKRLEKLNERFYGKKSGQHKKYLSEYRKNEEILYKEEKNRRNELLNSKKEEYDIVIDYVKKKYEESIDEIGKKMNSLDENYSKNTEIIDKFYHNEREGMEGVITLSNIREEQYKKENEIFQKNYSEQILAIKTQKEELSKQNAELNNQIELEEKIESLAKAESIRIKIFKDGKFIYAKNEEAISNAQKVLNDVIRKQEAQKLQEDLDKQISVLEKQKEYWDSYYNNLIEIEENFREQQEKEYQKSLHALEDNYNAQREIYEKQKLDEENKLLLFEQQISAYDTFKSELLASQLLLTENEKLNYDKRIENLQEFITKYLNLQSAISGGFLEGVMVAPIISAGSGIGAGTGGSSSNNKPPKKEPPKKKPPKKKPPKKKPPKKKASGSASLESDGLTIVGEPPNSEIIIGSKLNQSGVLMDLDKGTGIIKASETKTLASKLSALARSNTNTTTDISNKKTVSQSFNFGNITLPNVKNANEFVKELKQNYKNYAIQESFK